MKRLLLIIVALIATSATLSAQLLIDARSNELPFGKPKRLIRNGEMEYHFDRKGRVTDITMQAGLGNIVVDWGKKCDYVYVRHYLDGAMFDADRVNIVYSTSDSMKYMFSGNECVIYYDQCNRITRLKMRQMYSTFERICTYDDDNNRSSVTSIVEITNTTNVVNIEIEDVVCDHKGNWIELKVNIGGNVYYQYREIEYY